MRLKKETQLIILFLFFCFSLIFLYFLNIYQRQNLSKIPLESKKNPLEFEKPMPQKSNMSLKEINQVLKDMNIQFDKSLEIDDIR